MALSLPIYTIGYGTREISDFIALLKNYGIRYLIDVRSKPTSRYNPDFSRNSLQTYLAKSAIKYVFMGNTLGGQPTDENCYTDGRVDYAKLESKPNYKAGISRIKTAWDKQLAVAIMCTEGKPEECHRSKLIGQTLLKMNIPVVHIDQMGVLRQQQEIINRLTKGQLNLFDTTFTSRKQYLR